MIADDRYSHFYKTEQDGITISSTMRKVERYHWLKTTPSTEIPNKVPFAFFTQLSLQTTMESNYNAGNLYGSHDLCAASNMPNLLSTDKRQVG